MNTSDKKTMVYLGIGFVTLMSIWLNYVSDANSSTKTLIAVLILIIAAIAAFLYYKKSSIDTVENTEEYQKILKRMTEKDYLKQIADDIHLIKIIILVFAAVSVLSVLGILIYMVSIFSQFPK